MSNVVSPDDYRVRLPSLLANAEVIYFGAGIYRDISLTIDRPNRPIKLIGDPDGTYFESCSLVEKGILTTQVDITVSNIQFSGATSDRGNGAGIWHQGGNLTVEDCVFRDNQNGILAAYSPNTVVKVLSSTFIRNGAADGHAHGLYVADTIKELSLRDCCFLDTVTGHHIKTRAATTNITGCRIGDGVTGSASYAIDLPNGGDATIVDNVMRKAPKDQNRTFVHYGGDAALYDSNRLVISNNRFVGRSPKGRHLESPSRWPITIGVFMHQRAGQGLILNQNLWEKVTIRHAGYHGLQAGL